MIPSCDSTCKCARDIWRWNTPYFNYVQPDSSNGDFFWLFASVILFTMCKHFDTEVTCQIKAIEQASGFLFDRLMDVRMTWAPCTPHSPKTAAWLVFPSRTSRGCWTVFRGSHGNVLGPCTAVQDLVNEVMRRPIRFDIFQMNQRRVVRVSKSKSRDHSVGLERNQAEKPLRNRRTK